MAKRVFSETDFAPAESLPKRVFKADDFADAEPASSEPAKPQPEISQLESLGRGALGGLTLGFDDEIGGAYEGLKSALSGGEYGDAYAKERDSLRASKKAAEEANPKTAFVGNVLGSLPTMLIPGAAGVKGAAALGAISGLGNSEAEDVTGAVLDATVGAGLGAGAAGAGKLIDKGVKSIASTGANKLDDLSVYLANKRIAPTGKQAEALGDNPAARKARGEYIRDHLLNKFGGVRSAEGLSKDNKALMSVAGQSMDDVIDDVVKQRPDVKVNVDEAVRKLEDNFGDRFNLEINEGARGQLDKAIRDIQSTDGNVEAVRELMKSYGKSYKKGQDIIPERQEVINAARDFLNPELKNSIGQASVSKFGSAAPAATTPATAVGGRSVPTAAGAADEISDEVGVQVIPGVRGALEKYTQSANQYGLGKEVQRGIKQELKRSPLRGDNIAQVAGNLARDVGAGPASRAAKGLSKASEWSLEQYQNIIQSAASRGGPQAAATTNYLLQLRDPNFRRLIRGEEEDEDNGSSD